MLVMIISVRWFDQKLAAWTSQFCWFGLFFWTVKCWSLGMYVNDYFLFYIHVTHNITFLMNNIQVHQNSMTSQVDTHQDAIFITRTGYQFPQFLLISLFINASMPPNWTPGIKEENLAKLSIGSELMKPLSATASRQAERVSVCITK